MGSTEPLSGSTNPQLDIFAYLDYRAFCRDFYVSQKACDQSFSFRSFARKAGVASSYLKHIIDGKRNLSPEMSLKFAAGMGLQDQEVDYFEGLVKFNQAQDLEDKNSYFERLRKKRARALKPVGLADAVGLLSHWYVVAIKELVVNLNAIDPKIIQRVLRKRLPESLIQSVIDQLVGMGWLSLQEGKWTSSFAQIQFPDEVKSYVVRSFHSQMLELAAEALSDDLAEREFGSMIFTFPEDQIPLLKQKIKELQKELVGYIQDMSQNSSGKQLVYQFGIQCFSLEKGSEGGKNS